MYVVERSILDRTKWPILLVEQEVRQIEVHRRSEAGWISETTRDEESVTLRSVGVSVPLAEIYAGMDDLT